MKLSNYHRAWLSNHPERTEQWLIERLQDGFDVHHADGDHSNNDPLNLVLIEHVDHMRLHGASLIRPVGAHREAKVSRRIELGKLAYEAKEPETNWRSIENWLGLRTPKSDGNQAVLAAREYAASAGLPWPKPNASKPGRGVAPIRKSQHAAN